MQVFAGQREDGFFVDLGSIFDLGTLRPVQALHLIPSANAAGQDGLKGSNVHTIAIQVPRRLLTADGAAPTDPTKAASVIGVWSSASRQKVLVRNGPGDGNSVGPWVQVSRLGNPLINEVLIPIAKKDEWNGADPAGDSSYAGFYEQPELAALLPVLYPDVFPNLADLNDSGAARADLVAILLTGVPGGLVDGFQNNTGTTQADMLRLNMAIPPTASPNPLGVIGGDVAGYPNGRRVFDDTVAISLRAVAGALYPLIDSAFTPDEAATGLADGTNNDKQYLATFPYWGRLMRATATSTTSQPACADRGRHLDLRTCPRRKSMTAPHRPTHHASHTHTHDHDHTKSGLTGAVRDHGHDDQHGIAFVPGDLVFFERVVRGVEAQAGGIVLGVDDGLLTIALPHGVELLNMRGQFRAGMASRARSFWATQRGADLRVRTGAPAAAAGDPARSRRTGRRVARERGSLAGPPMSESPRRAGTVALSRPGGSSPRSQSACSTLDRFPTQPICIIVYRSSLARRALAGGQRSKRSIEVRFLRPVPAAYRPPRQGRPSLCYFEIRAQRAPRRNGRGRRSNEC